MSWLLRMAIRDARKSRLALLSVFVAFATSLAVLAALVTFSERLTKSVESGPKALLGADFVIYSRTRPAEDVRQFLNSIDGLKAELVQTNTMLRASGRDNLRIALVRGISPDFPIYGKIISEPQVDPALLDGAIVDGRLLDQLALKLGDSIRLGTVELKILARLIQVPGEIGGYGLIAPRVYVPLAQLERSGLTNYGSQARYSFLYRAGSAGSGTGERSYLRNLKTELSRRELELETTDDRERSVSKITDAVCSYLQLGGFFAFILGGLGLNVSLRAFFLSKQSSIRVLRVLGATGAQAAGIFAAQALAVICAASLTGLVAGALSFRFLGRFLKTVLPVEISSAPAISAFAGLLALSLIQSFAIVLLLIFEQNFRLKPPGLRIASFLLPLLCSGAAALALIRRSKIVLIGFGAFIICAALLFFCSYLSARALEYLIRLRLPYPVRFGMLQATRRFVPNSLVFMSVGIAIGVTVMSIQVRSAIRRQLDITLSGNRPNLFLFDVQPDQLEQTEALLAEQRLQRAEVVPVITMRLSAVNGVDVRELADREPERSRWVLRREYRTTYRDALIASEKVIDGTFSGRAEKDKVPISLERSIARDLRVKVGDSLTFNVQGVEVTTTVGSIREVDWKSGDINFFVIFPAGVLEDAPQYFALLTRYGSAGQLRNFESALNAKFPNISVIDIREMFAGVEKLLEQLSLIIEALGMAIAVVASMILVSSLLGTLLQRARSEALLRAVGATSGFVSSARAVELFAISAIGVLAGAILGGAASSLFIREFLDLPLSADWKGMLTAIVPIALLPIILGWAVSLRSAAKSTMDILRAE